MIYGNRGHTAFDGGLVQLHFPNPEGPREFRPWGESGMAMDSLAYCGAVLEHELTPGIGLGWKIKNYTLPCSLAWDVPVSWVCQVCFETLEAIRKEHGIKKPLMVSILERRG